MQGVVPAYVTAVQIASVQAVALYGGELWWDPKEGSWRYDLQYLLKRHARLTPGTVPSTSKGKLMRHGGLIPAAVALDARQRWFVSRLASTCESSKAKECYYYPTPGAPVGTVPVREHARGKRAERVCWLDLGKNPAFRTTILEDDAAANTAADLWAKRTESNVGSTTSRWRTDRSRTDDGSVASTAVRLNTDGWTVFRSYLGTLQIEVFQAEHLAIGDQF